MRVGQFLLDQGIINSKQLNEALLLQRDNTDRLIGEILVTLGAISKEDLIMAMEMFLMTTGEVPNHVEEWLDQDEIDLIMNKMHDKKL
jgi:hypothetical protein